MQQQPKTGKSYKNKLIEDKTLINPVFFHLWGPLSIHAYGVCIALGACIAFALVLHDKILKKIISTDDLATSFQIIVLAGYFGGRICCMLSQPEPIDDYLFLLKFWEPGYSILGSIIGITTALVVYLRLKKIPILIFADRIALYAPLVQGFGRLGCFFAGCCYGKTLTAWWSVTYTDPYHMAPLHQSLHPAQLYSSFMLFGLFFFLFFFMQHRLKKPGILFCMYLLCASMERFLIDFIRWDRVFTVKLGFFSLLSMHQWIALCVSAGAITCMICITKCIKK